MENLGRLRGLLPPFFGCGTPFHSFLVFLTAGPPVFRPHSPLERKPATDHKQSSVGDVTIRIPSVLPHRRMLPRIAPLGATKCPAFWPFGSTRSSLRDHKLHFAKVGELELDKRQGSLKRRFPRQPPCTIGIRADYLLGFILAPVVRSRSNQHDGMDLGSSGSPPCSPLTSVCRSSRLARSVPVPSGSAPPRLCRPLLAATEKPPPAVPAINYTVYNTYILNI